jgi:hypothetical protein
MPEHSPGTQSPHWHISRAQQARFRSGSWSLAPSGRSGNPLLACPVPYSSPGPSRAPGVSERSAVQPRARARCISLVASETGDGGSYCR